VGVIEVLGHLARFDDAEEYVKRAQRLAPEDPAIRTAVGILLFRRGLYARAEVELRPVCDGDSEHATAHYYRGEALNRLGRVDEALEVLARAIELEPDDVRPYHTLGRLYDRKNQPEDAARMYRRARELTGS
jgi:Flp pilus assembly protein TadD